MTEETNTIECMKCCRNVDVDTLDPTLRRYEFSYDGALVMVYDVECPFCGHGFYKTDRYERTETYYDEY